ncbi:MAG TPA: hypothetical protein VEA18_01690 [Candidatus Kapabacteria bacterium]|nr:hypothetical protein [Candidatus Kapabacteria bacterium]
MKNTTHRGSRLSAAVLTLALAVTTMVTPANATNEPGSTPGIELIRSYQTNEGFRGVFKNTAGDTKTVLVNIELYNEQGTKVAQRSFDNVMLRAGSSVEYWLSPAYNLPNGKYHYSVSIFGQNWNGLQRWYDKVQTFTKNGNTKSTNQVLSITSDVVRVGNPEHKISVFIHSGNVPTGASVVTEVYNTEGKKVASRSYPNIVINENKTKTFELYTPDTMGRGMYTFKVGIFSPDWGTLYKWEDNAGSFTIK